MVKLARIAAAGVVLTAVGFVAAACQTQQAPPPDVTAETLNALSVAEVQALVTGNTVIGFEENEISRRLNISRPTGRAN